MGQAKHAPITRRSALAATFALSTAAGAGSVVGIDRALAAEAHPDAAILALVPDLARLQAASRASLDGEMRAEDRAHHLARTRLGGETAHERADWVDALEAAKAEIGFDAAKATHLQAFDALRDRLDTLAEIPATTLDGLIVKARYADDYDYVEASIVEDLIAIGEARQGQVRA